MNKFTKEQKEGMGHLMDWFENIHHHQPMLYFTYEGYLNARAGRIVQWLSSKMTDEGYSDDGRVVLNALRLIYVLNRNKGGSDALITEIKVEGNAVV